MISPKYLAEGVFTKSSVRRMKEHSPIALWKSWGFFDTNLGQTLRGVIVGDKGPMDRIRKGSLWLAGKTDDITWGALWNAVEHEIRDTRKDLAPGSDAFYEAVASRFGEIVDRTQVVDTMFHRSQYMRAPDGFKKLTSSFMSEPTKTYNMVRNAVMDTVQEPTMENKAKLARVCATYIVTGVATAAMAAVADAFRDDDDEKEWWEKYLHALIGYDGEPNDILRSNVVSGLNPLNLLPLTSDIMGMLEGYSPSRMDMDGIDDVLSIAPQWKKFMDGETELTVYSLISSSAKALSKLTGIPVGNLMRSFESIYSTISPDGYGWKQKMTLKKQGYVKEMEEKGIDNARGFMLGYPSQSKAAKLGYIATFDHDGDGSPDLDKNEMNIVAAVMGIHIAAPEWFVTLMAIM